MNPINQSRPTARMDSLGKPVGRFNFWGPVVTDSPEFRRTQRLLNKRVRQLRAKASVHELRVKAALAFLGVDFIHQKGWMCQGEALRVTDFYLPAPVRLIIEVDGPEHDLPARKKDDRLRTKQVNLCGRFRWLRIRHSTIAGLSDGMLADWLRRKISTGATLESDPGVSG